MKQRTTFAILLFLGEIGCGGVGSEHKERIIEQNKGPLCIRSSLDTSVDSSVSSDQEKEMHNDLFILSFVSSQCFSSSCYSNWNTSCTAVVNENSINIETYLEYDKLTDSSSCTADCRIVGSSCASPRLIEGRYTVVYGDICFELAIPISVDSLCLDDIKTKACNEPAIDRDQ